VQFSVTALQCVKEMATFDELRRKHGGGWNADGAGGAGTEAAGRGGRDRPGKGAAKGDQAEAAATR
jgi:hypothetical protein